MNAHVQEALNEIAKESGAVVSCETCGNNYIRAHDGDAESKAYAMATNAWKDGNFRSASREEILAAMKDVIIDANNECPSCG